MPEESFFLLFIEVLPASLETWVQLSSPQLLVLPFSQ